MDSAAGNELTVEGKSSLDSRADSTITGSASGASFRSVWMAISSRDASRPAAMTAFAASGFYSYAYFSLV
jgi:hypothetical protein